MKIAIAHLTSNAIYAQARFYTTPKLEKESSADYEIRTWRDRLHTFADEEIYIPPMAFKNCLSESAKFLSIQIPGKGKSTYTKHFEAGVLCINPVPLGIYKHEARGLDLFLPSDGVRGSGKRVRKIIPAVDSWSAAVEFRIADETITLPVFEEVLKNAGILIGIGFFRPRNNGYYGRFKVDKIEWNEWNDD